MKHKLESRLLGEISIPLDMQMTPPLWQNNLRYADDTTLMAESEEELKSLDERERGERKSWLKTQYSENLDHGI